MSRNAPPSFGGALRDIPKDGCEGRLVLESAHRSEAPSGIENKLVGTENHTLLTNRQEIAMNKYCTVAVCRIESKESPDLNYCCFFLAKSEVGSFM